MPVTGVQTCALPILDRPGERAFRLVTAFDTDPKDIDRFLSIAKAA